MFLAIASIGMHFYRSLQTINDISMPTNSQQDGIAGKLRENKAQQSNKNKRIMLSNRKTISGDEMNILLQNEVTQVKERDEWFHSTLEHENESLAKLSLNTFYGGIMIQPNAVCPADLLKTTSVSKHFDGGKWLCGASRLRAISQEQNRPCIVYSLGCQFETSFERSIQGMTGNGCEIHIYDPTMGPPEKVSRFKNDLEKERMYLHEIAIKGTEGHSSLKIGDSTYKVSRS